MLVHSERVDASLGEDLAITYQMEVMQHIVPIILLNEMHILSTWATTKALVGAKIVVIGKLRSRWSLA